MSAILQTTFLNQLSYIKIVVFSLKFHRLLSQGSNLANIISEKGLATNRRQTIIWTNDGLVY